MEKRILYIDGVRVISRDFSGPDPISKAGVKIKETSYGILDTFKVSIFKKFIYSITYYYGVYKRQNISSNSINSFKVQEL